ncbi:MAG TPA: hypothetical protein VG318_01675 [Actinomycetota bacterium]|nr:hypothetical protein [Actinomycetota bacterium]
MDGKILAQEAERPSLGDRYRFYFAGEVPPRHPHWARRHLRFGRWLASQVLVESLCWAAGLLWIRLVTGSWEEAHALFFVGLLALVVFTPIRAAYRHGRMTRGIAAPDAGEVLASIGEGSPSLRRRMPPLR